MTITKPTRAIASMDDSPNFEPINGEISGVSNTAPTK